MNNANNHKTKILIATGIYPPDIGGPATMLGKMAEALVAHEFDVKILTYAERPVKIRDGVERVLRNRIRFFSSAKYFVKMFKMSCWADVVYVTDLYSVGYFAYLMRKITRKKYIVRFAGDSAWETATARGWTRDYIVDFQKNRYDKEIERMKERRKKILTSATAVIAVSDFMSGVAEMIGVEKSKIFIVYNSVDFMEKADDETVNKIRNRFDGDSKIIVTACRLVLWKGVDGIIKMLPKLIANVGNINFLVLGDGAEMENLKQLAVETGVENNVHFLGKIPREDIMAYLGAADLFILNTNYEGLSHTILEAMLAGAPLAATDAGGNPEAVENGENGVLVEYNNEEQLLGAATRILSDKALAEKFVRNAREKLKKFNWADSVKKTIDAINKITWEGPC